LSLLYGKLEGWGGARRRVRRRMKGDLCGICWGDPVRWSYLTGMSTEHGGLGDTLSTLSRYEGTMLGLAIGDALGYAVEFVSLETIRSKFGPAGIQELVLTRQGVALFSDDTQMSLAVCAGLRRAHETVGPYGPCEAVAPFVAREFINWSERPVGGHRAPGGACMAGCRALAAGVPWEEAGGPEAGGCGSVMRSAPYALRFFDDREAAIEFAVRHSRMTHRHPIALAASAGLAAGVWAALHGESVSDVCDAAVLAARRYCDVTAEMVGSAADAGFYARRTPHRRQQEADRVLDLNRGWAAHEALAAAIFCYAAGEDFPEVVRLGANSPGDSDSIASIAGALAGATFGRSGIPDRWIAPIERLNDLLTAAFNLHSISRTKRG